MYALVGKITLTYGSSDSFSFLLMLFYSKSSKRSSPVEGTFLLVATDLFTLISGS